MSLKISILSEKKTPKFTNNTYSIIPFIENPSKFKQPTATKEMGGYLGNEDR
jgi:hypothetical protein